MWRWTCQHKCSAVRYSVLCDHPEGEVVLTKASNLHNVVQTIPTLASCSFDEIVGASHDDQIQWPQLYVNKDCAITQRIVKHAEACGSKALFIIVDAPQLGRCERICVLNFRTLGLTLRLRLNPVNLQLIAYKVPHAQFHLSSTLLRHGMISLGSNKS